MNFNHLAVFFAVAERQSVSKGADQLLISQPAASKQIGELERALATPLFDRLPRGVRLTEAGALLHEYARRLFGIADEAQRALDELRGLHRGRLSIAASTTIGVYLLPEILVRFRRQYPGVRMHLEIANSEIIRTRLLEGAVDVGFTEVAIDDDAFESEIFLQDRLVAIAHPRHALARKRSITAKRLCEEPFVVRETGSETKSLVERALTERGLSIEPAMSLGSTEAIKRAVAAGVGVAIVSSLSIALEIRARQLAALRVSNLAIQRPLNRVKVRGSYVSRAVTAFDELLNQAMIVAEKMKPIKLRHD